MSKNVDQILKEALLPEEQPREILNQKVLIEARKRKMKTNKTRIFYKKYSAVAAAFVLCVCLTGVTALAATGALEGFFKDIIGWNGTVIGTTYEQATEEMEVTIIEVSNQLTLEVEMRYPKNMPYREMEKLALESYKIVDSNGVVIGKGTTEMTQIVDGKVVISISLESVPDGTYRLIISEIAGGKKADQPLVMIGNWECEFTR